VVLAECLLARVSTIERPNGTGAHLPGGVVGEVREEDTAGDRRGFSEDRFGGGET